MRPAACIVVLVHHEWAVTRGCLETLRPTLGLRDEVLLVTSGPLGADSADLRRYPWIRVVSAADPSAAVARAGAASRHDVVVVLDDDAVLPSRWLDGLLSPFADADVDATGPRSNAGAGPQHVPDVPHAPGRTADLQRFARQWRSEHRGQVTRLERLSAPCVAVRRSLLERLGGLGGAALDGTLDTDDLCQRIARAGARCAIAHEAFVHFGRQPGPAADRSASSGSGLESQQDGSRGAAPSTREPLLSAALIVLDEEERLAACLDSLRGLVDEIVVYDTGSTDRTREIARACGALVVEGFWDDDFGRARNEALAACSGRWVLSVDADEVVEGDRLRLRRELERSSHVDTVDLPIDNLDHSGEVVLTHQATRLFRRRGARWEGRLHERVVATSAAAFDGASTSTVRLRHSGYTPEAVRSRGKAERNLRLARADVERHAGDARAVQNLARSLNLAGLADEAIDTYADVRRLTADGDLLRQTLREGAQLLLEVGRAHRALEWIRDLREHTSSSSMPDYLEALARIELGDRAGALGLLARIDRACDEDCAVSPHELRYRRGLLLAAERRWAEAAEALLHCVQGRRVVEPIWAPLVEACWRTGVPMAQVADHVSDDQLLHVLGQVEHAPAEAADALAEALFLRDASSTTLLAFVVSTAPRLALLRSLEWSARLRSAGLASSCPLIAVALDATVEPVVRLRAAAVAHETFRDQRGRAATAAAAAAVAVPDFHRALLTVDELSPGLLHTFVLGAASDSARALALADVLSGLGAAEAAADLLTTAG